VSDRYPQRNFQPPPDAVEVLLVRHGASEPAIPGRPFRLTDDGQGDPPLAREGRAQAELMARRLEAEPLAGLFVSTLRRTAETAAPLAAATGLEPVVVPDLREVHLGDWEGGELRIRAAGGDPLFARMLAEERWDTIPGAEPMDDFAARVRGALTQIVDSAESGTCVAAVAHGAVIGELCRQATDSRRFAFVHADNASITRLVVLADGRWLLRNFNDTAHLNGAV
jgi:probable phosphoglycerate mutase